MAIGREDDFEFIRMIRISRLCISGIIFLICILY